MNKKLIPLALAATFAVSAPALADTITLTIDSFARPPADTITISSPGSLPNPSPGAGEFHASVQSYANTSPGNLSSASFVDSQNDFFLYCYELTQTFHWNTSYTYNVNYSGAASRTLDFLGAVNYVLNGNSNTWTDPYAWLHPADKYVSAAIQIGIWESLYDTSGWSLTAGNFRANGLDSGTQTDFGNFVGALGAANSVALNQTMVLENGDHQNQITGLRPPRRQDLPEPGSLALIAAGLIAGGIARRKRKA